MNKYKKPNFREEDLGTNPLLNRLEITVKKVRGRQEKDDDGNYHYKEFELDLGRTCKIYIDADTRMLVNSLIPRSKELLLWIMYSLTVGKDYLWLNRERYMSECNVSSKTTYKKAVDDLIMNNFINKTVVSGVFWINPCFFFSGSRVNNFPGNIAESE